MNDFEKARLDVAEKEQDRVRRLAAAEQAPRSVVAQWAQAENAALQKQTARHMTCDVFKPASVQPGAPNEFLLVINNLDTIPTGRVVAEVRDQTDAVIYSQPIDYEQHQQHSLRLPASVWTRLTPQSELFLSVASVDPKSQKRTELHDRIRLLGPVYSTLLTTDKPTYRPGETVYFRSLTLDRGTFTPPKHEQVLQYELRGPNGLPVHDGVVTGGTELTRLVDGRLEKILGPDGNPLRGVGTGAIAIPHDAADGEYSLVLKELPGAGGYRPALPFSVGRPVKVRAHPGESYRKEIRYLHEGKQAASFVAGQTVEAVAQLNLHDTAQKNVEVEALATADDQVVFRGGAKTRDNGEAAFRFMLPKELKRGDVRLEVTFRTQTGAEVLAERVPVIGRNVIVEFFPEGGPLVAGVPCRVYFRATTPGGLPVDIAGMVTDGEKVLAEVETVRDREDGANRGIGVFAFTPALGTPVWLKLRTPTATYEPLLPPDPEKIAVAPAAIAGTAAVIASRTGFLLPPAEPQGVVMTVPDPVTAPGQPIRVHLRSVAQPRNLVVGAYTRGRLSDTQRVKVEPGQVKEVPLMAGTDPRGGVVRITVFEDPSEVPAAPVTDLKPVAERLVYRKPGELLKLDLAVNGAREGEGFAPDTAVQLGITATRQGEKRTPAAAVLYAAAVNSAVEPGKKDRLLTSHFLIAGEINTPDDLEHADFLLSDRPKAAETLDLVLATQGWRRFAEQTPVQMAQRQRRATEDFTSLALHNGQYPVRTEPQWLKEHQNLTETYMPRFDAAVEKLKSVRAAVEAEKADTSGEDRVRDLAAKVDDARMAATGRVKDAAEATTPLARFQGAGWYAVAGFGLLALLLGGASLARSGVRLPLGIGTVGSIGLVAFLVFSLGTAERTLASVKEIDRVSLPKPVIQPGEEAGHP
ncbi:MAG TPA: hypothetical protein VLM40_23925, partial [Gemmata sp.]|nr:hypothetical protein [Gemmata sp.]